MGDLAAVEEVAETGGGNERGLELLLCVEGGGRRGPDAARDEREASVGLDGRVGLDREQELHLVGLVASLLAQLADGGLRRRLSRIDDAARDLEREGVAAEPVLPYEDHLFVRGDRDDVAPVASPKRVRVAARSPVGVLELEADHREDAVVGERLGAHAAPRPERGRRQSKWGHASGAEATTDRACSPWQRRNFRGC